MNALAEIPPSDAISRDIRPVRLQLSRRKGFSLQALSLATNGLPAVNVARPSLFGNPYRAHLYDSGEGAVDAFRRLFEQPPSRLRHLILRICKNNRGRGEGHILRMKQALPELRGKNLACWCRGDAPFCHADVLLTLANKPICEAA